MNTLRPHPPSADPETSEGMQDSKPHPKAIEETVARLLNDFARRKLTLSLILEECRELEWDSTATDLARLAARQIYEAFRGP